MPSIRRDAFTGAYVLVSEQRSQRPANIARPIYRETGGESCPFCPGNEAITPKALNAGEETWELRWFPNKYPALLGSFCPNEALSHSGGFHEIFVDTRSHEDELKDFTTEHMTHALSELKSRFSYYRELDGIEYVQVFKNKGARAGASQKHSHWQLVAGGFVPSMQEIISRNLALHSDETGECLYCQRLDEELSDRARLVYENEGFAVITPYASRFTYESWIMPKEHIPSFSQLNERLLPLLCNALLRLLNALDSVKSGIDYNILLMDAPKNEHEPLFHWHMQIVPRLGGLAGYEFSTGSYINHIAPEAAAEKLKSLINYKHGGKNE